VSKQGLSAKEIEAMLSAGGIPAEGLDIEWLRVTTLDAEASIVELRDAPGFTSAAPAFSVWPELSWSKADGAKS
jgi:hypothetical protein